MCISYEQCLLVAKGLYTDGRASRMARQGLDLCPGWLRAASRNIFAFPNCFRGGSCVAGARYHVSEQVEERKVRLEPRNCGGERVMAGYWSRLRVGFAGASPGFAKQGLEF